MKNFFLLYSDTPVCRKHHCSLIFHTLRSEYVISDCGLQCWFLVYCTYITNGKICFFTLLYSFCTCSLALDYEFIKIKYWIKTCTRPGIESLPTASASRQPFGTETVSDTLIAAIEKLTEAGQTKEVVMQVRPHLLYLPNQFAGIMGFHCEHSSHNRSYFCLGINSRVLCAVDPDPGGKIWK